MQRHRTTQITKETRESMGKRRTPDKIHSGIKNELCVYGQLRI